MLKRLLIILTTFTFLFTFSNTHADETSRDNVPRHKPDAKAWKADRANGQKALEQKQYAQADHFFRAALDEARNFGPKDDRVVESLLDLGKLYAATGNFIPAEPLLREVVDVRRDDPNQLVEAESIAPYAIVSMKLGHYDEAARTYARMQELLSRKYGADHPLVVNAMLERGIAYAELRDFTQAEPLLERCADLFQNPTSRVVMRPTETALHGSQTFRETFRPNYINAVRALGVLDLIYFEQGKMDEAQSHLKKALAIVDENSGKSDVALTEVLRQLSAAYISSKNYPAAEPTLQRLIRIEEKNPSPDGRETMKDIERLAKIYFDQQDYAQAEPLYRREAEQAEKFQSSDLSEILSDQVVIYEKLGRDAELAAVCQKQAAAYEKMFGPNSRALVKPLNDAAAALRREKKDVEAQALEDRAKTIQAAQAK